MKIQISNMKAFVVFSTTEAFLFACNQKTCRKLKTILESCTQEQGAVISFPVEHSIKMTFSNSLLLQIITWLLIITSSQEADDGERG